MTWVPQKLTDYASALLSGGPVEIITVSEFLKWFGAKRKGPNTIESIRAALQQVGLLTDPDFDEAGLQSSIAIRPRAPAERGELHDSSGQVELRTTEAKISRTPSEIIPRFVDPTFRISRLPAATQPPISVTPDATIAQVATIMMARDFSQLPVMQSPRDVKGMVSWRSIGHAAALGQRSATARDCIERHYEVNFDTSLLSAIADVSQHDVILVRDNSRKICGIVTTSDLSIQFAQLSEPFLLLGEIENQLRLVVNRYFTFTEIASAAHAAPPSEAQRGAADLTFGDYRVLLEQPSNWERTKINLDRRIFIDDLESVRKIRNTVMHFDPDGIEDEDILILRRFARLLDAVAKSSNADFRVQ
jgi:CBS domain-containing protein